VSTLPTFPAAPPAKPRKNLWQTIAIVALFLGPVGGVLVWKVGKSTYQDYQIASAAADHFHQQLNTGDYDHIYESATDEFRRWGKREDPNRFFDNIRQKMGNAGTPSSLGFHVNWRNGVLWVDQTFNTNSKKDRRRSTSCGRSNRISLIFTSIASTHPTFTRTRRTSGCADNKSLSRPFFRFEFHCV